DSLLAAASAARARLTTFDGLSLDRQVAASRHDWKTQVVASRRLLRLAPSSEEALYWFASDAVATNRFDEAIRAVHAFDRQRRPRDENPVLSSIDRDGHHFAGDFEGELADVRRDRERGATGSRACNDALRP